MRISHGAVWPSLMSWHLSLSERDVVMWCVFPQHAETVCADWGAHVCEGLFHFVDFKVRLFGGRGALLEHACPCASVFLSVGFLRE